MFTHVHVHVCIQMRSCELFIEMPNSQVQGGLKIPKLYKNKENCEHYEHFSQWPEVQRQLLGKGSEGIVPQSLRGYVFSI